MTLPDLRPEMVDVELEHCSVLTEALRAHLTEIYEGDAEEFSEICDRIDAVQMRKDLLKLFTPKAFLTLFRTPFGRGVLVGSFVQKFVFVEEDL